MCATGPISFVFIDNHSIFEADDPAIEGRFGFAYRLANKLHRRTKRSVIERELLFGPGDCYDPYLLEETERLLRGFRFLSQVDVFGVPQPDGTYHVVVDTRDQWSTQLDLRLGFESGVSLEGFRISETNLLGTGQELGFFYRSRDVTRDYGVSFATPQLARTRWDLRGALGKTRAGTVFAQTIAYPFVGEVSRWAARQTFIRDDQFFDYIAVDDTRKTTEHVLLPLREKNFDVALGTRFGHRGNLSSVGAVLSYNELSFTGPVEMALSGNFDERVPADSATTAEVASQMQPTAAIRVGVLFGQRYVRWVKKRGFDSMRGQQDVALGVDATFSVARSLPALERDDDMVGTAQVYTGVDGGNALLTARARLDVRYNFDAAFGDSKWQDVYGDGELLGYWKPSALGRHTFFVRASTIGAWNTRTPFQLTLGGDRNLRGYREERFPGGRRLVINAEDRIYFGWPFREVLDVGGTVFADFGRMLPGDVPFGINSGWRASAGFGLRGSFPAGGRSTFRIDFAMPLDQSNFRNYRILISASELLGISALGFQDVQLLRSRREGIAAELFRNRNQ